TVRRVGGEDDAVDLTALLLRERGEQIEPDLAFGKRRLASLPGERPVPVELELVVLLDDRLFPVRERRAGRREAELESAGRVAIVAVPDPDPPGARDGDVEVDPRNRLVVGRAAGDRHEVALAALGPLG